MGQGLGEISAFTIWQVGHFIPMQEIMSGLHDNDTESQPQQDPGLLSCPSQGGPRQPHEKNSAPPLENPHEFLNTISFWFFHEKHLPRRSISCMTSLMSNGPPPVSREEFLYCPLLSTAPNRSTRSPTSLSPVPKPDSERIGTRPQALGSIMMYTSNWRPTGGIGPSVLWPGGTTW
jgi:hypothetical protein